MSEELSKLIQTWAGSEPNSSESLAVSVAITNGNFPAEEFTDDIFSSLSREKRLLAYGLLLMWCKSGAAAIWRRRHEIETDYVCRKMIESLQVKFDPESAPKSAPIKPPRERWPMQ